MQHYCLLKGKSYEIFHVLSFITHCNLQKIFCSISALFQRSYFYTVNQQIISFTQGYQSKQEIVTGPQITEVT